MLNLNFSNEQVIDFLHQHYKLWDWLIKTTTTKPLKKEHWPGWDEGKPKTYKGEFFASACFLCKLFKEWGGDYCLECPLAYMSDHSGIFGCLEPRCSYTGTSIYSKWVDAYNEKEDFDRARPLAIKIRECVKPLLAVLERGDYVGQYI